LECSSQPKLIVGGCKRILIRTYSDGGARGNPGPSAAAYLILSEDGKTLKSESRFLGRHTNNQAEYEALIAALQAAVVFGSDDVVCHLDSELVCKHMTGEYKVKNPDLRKLYNRANDLRHNFRKISFVNVPRTDRFMQEADRLVNERLDETAAKHA
jgi:ribonuclease HI